MARPPRIEYEGACYHVTSRGNDRQAIFFSDRDYRKFLEYLAAAKQKYGCLIHAYVLMPNHYHLLLETPSPNLSRIMHFINGSYTTYINIKHQRTGHLFQGRFKALIVDREAYLLELTRYIHLNPVRASIAEHPENYPYSSYHTYVTEKNGLVTTEPTLALIHHEITQAREYYRRFVQSAVGLPLSSPIEKPYAGLIVGNDRFVQRTLVHLRREQLATQETGGRRALMPGCDPEEVLSAVEQQFQMTRSDVLWSKTGNTAKVIAMYLLKRMTSLSNGEVGRLFDGISPSAIAQTVRRMEVRLQNNKTLEIMVASIMSQVKG